MFRQVHKRVIIGRSQWLGEKPPLLEVEGKMEKAPD